MKIECPYHPDTMIMGCSGCNPNLLIPGTNSTTEQFKLGHKMKIEKLGLVTELGNMNTLLGYYEDCENKINEIIDQTNENTEILTKTIRVLDTVVNRFNSYFNGISEALK